ncbi:hypothetical protein ZWY2020_026261 [Hordeum vulgare]|nr:hypothetical protein ZWY2020_026261 [Hordeum vulgare]
MEPLSAPNPSGERGFAPSTACHGRSEPRIAGGGTSIRKYVGALKDSTTVSIAKVNSDYKQLDIAIVKATNHVERPAKEKYIRGCAQDANCDTSCP